MACASIAASIPAIPFRPLYDSLLGKIIAHGDLRDDALDSLIGAVEDVRVDGIATNASWLVRALREPDFRTGR